MKNTSKIAVIGGTGKSGKYLVSELIKQNYSIKVLVRNPDNITIKNEFLDIVEGNIADIKVVKNLLMGCSAVISTLGWGNPPSPNHIFSLATQNILEAMAEFNIRRYIVVSGLHVDTSMDEKSQNNKTATIWMYENYAEATKNKQEEYEMLQQSNLDWTLIRLPLIELTHESREIGTSLKDCLGDKISATDLASFLIEQLKEDSFNQKAPFLFNL